MIANYPPFDDTTKEGPVGPPGIGFKLTDEGDYDMENKILKNASGPVDDQDLITKSYFKAKIEEVLKLLYENTIQLVVGKAYDAKNKRIGNVGDPRDDKNVVNKRYFEQNCVFLINEKFSAKNKIITNVSEPENDKDAVNKKYLDMRLPTYVTMGHVLILNPRVHTTVEFDVIKGNLLKLDAMQTLRFTIEMKFKLTLFHNTRVPIEVNILKGSTPLLVANNEFNRDSFTVFGNCVANDVLIIQVRGKHGGELVFHLFLLPI